MRELTMNEISFVTGSNLSCPAPAPSPTTVGPITTSDASGLGQWFIGVYESAIELTVYVAERILQ